MLLYQNCLTRPVDRNWLTVPGYLPDGRCPDDDAWLNVSCDHAWMTVHG